jgi:hypothetical protein
MQKKSKVLALFLCMAMLVAALPLMAYAEGESPITITAVDIADNSEDDTLLDVTVTYTTDDSVVGDQITILATTTSYDVEYDDVTGETNIQYIDQFEKPSESEKTFSFVVSKDSLGSATVLYVKIGGSNVDSPGQLTGELAVILYGDVNGDGVVTGTDAGLVAQYFAEIITEFPAANGLIAADVNGDGSITGTDAGLIAQYYAEIISIFPVEQK